MRILVIGSTGQLGWELQRSLDSLGTIIAVDYPELDLVRPDSIIDCINNSEPDLIINAAAYTAVDQAEKEPDLAVAVNGQAPGILAEQALRRGSILIHYSTDYVFDGQKGYPYTEEDQPNPINIYGRSKLAGEDAIEQVGGEFFIFRTSWLYSTRKECFPLKVLRWARSHEIVKIVVDQIGSPTWARTLADSTARALEVMLGREKSWREARAGVYHTAGIGEVSRFTWAESILKMDPHPEEQVLRELQPARSAEFQIAAQRPTNSSLNCARFQKTFDAFYNPWKEDLKRAFTAPID